MNQGPNRVLDEFAKFLTDGAGAAQNLKREAKTAIHSQLERLMSDMDLVSREEFEAVKAMAVKAREENKALRKLIEESMNKQS